MYSQGVPDSHLGLIMSALANGLVSRKIANKAEYYAMEFGAVAKQGLTVKRKRLRHYGAPESTLKNIFLDCFSEKDSALVLLVSYYLTNVLILSLNFYTLNLALEIAIPGPEVTLNSSLVSLITASVLGSYLAYQSYDGIKVNVNIIEQLVDLTLSSKEYMSFKLNGLTQKVEAKVTLDSPQKGLYFNHSAKDNVFLAKDLENRTRSALLNR